jgi:RND family efflux transporter MFP subunit
MRTQSTRHPPRAIKLALALFALALGIPALGVLTTGLNAAEPVSPQPQPLGVRTLAVEPASGYHLRRVYSGRVEPLRESDLGLERGGLVESVLVREGEAVSKGQALARLDTGLLRAQRAELEAALGQAEADLSLAEATLVRYRGSVDQGAVTRQALDETREGARAASAAVKLARARIDSVDLEIAKAELRAPFAGIVTRRLADEGRVLPAGEPLVRVQELATPELRVGVAGVLVGALEVGGAYELDSDAGLIRARLRALLPVRSGAARTVDALFVPEDPGQDAVRDLRSGDLVELALAQWIEEPGVWLPLEVLTQGSRGLWSAYALESGPDAGANVRLAVRPLELIHQDGDRVFVRGALAAGDRLVAAGVHRVVPGQLVRPLPEGEALAAADRAAAETGTR